MVLDAHRNRGELAAHIGEASRQEGRPIPGGAPERRTHTQATCTTCADRCRCAGHGVNHTYLEWTF